jgi:hypothetical protein
MHRSPRDVVEQVRRMVAGEGVVFADLFATDGVLRYPFAPPGTPGELRGRRAIRDDYMDPIAMATLPGRTPDLVAALSAA